MSVYEKLFSRMVEYAEARGIPPELLRPPIVRVTAKDSNKVLFHGPVISKIAIVQVAGTLHQHGIALEDVPVGDILANASPEERAEIRHVNTLLSMRHDAWA